LDWKILLQSPSICRRLSRVQLLESLVSPPFAVGFPESKLLESMVSVTKEGVGNERGCR
jgi:hypothetical protein